MRVKKILGIIGHIGELLKCCGVNSEIIEELTAKFPHDLFEISRVLPA